MVFEAFLLSGKLPSKGLLLGISQFYFFLTLNCSVPLIILIVFLHTTSLPVPIPLRYYAHLLHCSFAHLE